MYIAVVGPIGQPSGKAMRQGVELYREEINKQGGIDGRKLELIFRDDQNKPKQAERIALELSENNNVLLVLGHYYDSTSKAAGKIYKKNGIPAITASAGAESVIHDNEWYFRSIPGNTGEASFVAAYIFDITAISKNTPLEELVLESISASIIFSKDEYGESLLKKFEEVAESYRIDLRGKWEWDYEKSSTEQLEFIKKKLAAIDEPGVIYLATHAAEGVQIITALKDEGRTYPLIVSSALARSLFDKLKTYAKEWENPGYYSDDIFFVSPFMLALSGVKGFEFAQEFIEKYDENPGVVSACYYDAVRIALQAIKKSGIHGKKHIREDRRNIRKTLAGMYNNENGVKGVTGQLWFDENGGVRREYAVGRWHKQKELPTFIQYDQRNSNVDEILQGVLDGEAILPDGLVLTSTRIVHVSVTDFELLNINKEKSEFSAAFQLNFHYPADFDKSLDGSVTSPLEFSNALSPIVLGDPIQENVKDEQKDKVFKVKGRFQADLKSDRQELFIRFRHTRMTYDSLIYVSATDDDKSLTQFFCYSDILSKNTTLGNPENFDSDFSLNYSRLNIVIRR